MKFTVILLIIYASTTISEDRVEETGKQYYCGRRLHQVYEIVCSNINSQELKTKELPMHFESNSNRKIMKREVMASLVETCCENPCGREDLFAFC